jgi:D-sedoheptulose 7-phosphate isomerase
MSLIEEKIKASISVKAALLADKGLLQRIEQSTELLLGAFRQGGKVLFCGNGGSAADAQHIAAELSGRFYLSRPPLYAEALHVNGSYLTAVANDYGYEAVYARMVEAAGRPGDVLVAISTSGNSPNILLAAEKARALGLHVVALTGNQGGKLAPLADILVNIPSDDTPRIQEAHILVGHIWCEMVESAIFGNP